jgi:hypothetical protein
MKRFRIGYKRSIDTALFDSFMEKCRKEGKLLYSDDARFYFSEREAEAAFGDFTKGDKKGVIAYLIRIEKSQYERYLKSTLS